MWPLLLSPAWAGFGVTAALGTDARQEATIWAPSLDWRTPGLLVQVHLLDQLRFLVDGGPFYASSGVDVTGVGARGAITEQVEGVAMFGGGARLDTANGDAGWYVVAEARFGAEAADRMGIGAYVVPYVGLTNLIDGTPAATYGGSLQVSVWFAKQR